MKYSIKHVAIGIGAFIFAVTASSVIGTIVNAVIPNTNKPDPDGKLEPDPQVKAKAEWLQQLEGGGPKADESTTNQTKDKDETVTAEASATQTQEPAPKNAEPAPQPSVPAAPPAPQTGPGNFDSTPSYTPPPAIQTGPGNM